MYFCDCAKRKCDVELRNISTPRAQQTIRTKVLEQDLIALEAKLHDNCLSTYVYILKAERVKKKKKQTKKEKQKKQKNNLIQNQNH